MNPFKARGLSVAQTAAEKSYVTWATVDKIVDYCPEVEWKLLFTLVRSIPVRVPSEIRELTWNDVDWNGNSILIHSPKTRKLGRSARLVPIPKTLYPLLQSYYFENPDDPGQYVFPRLRLHSNLGKAASDLLVKAKIKVWSNFFNSLRASTETDLMDQHGIRKACQWEGNSPATAMKNYALVRKSDFIEEGQLPRIFDAKSDAIFDRDAKSDAAPDCVVETGSTETPEKTALSSVKSLNKETEVGGEGLEEGDISGEKVQTLSDATRNPTRSDLAGELLIIWEQLGEREQQKLLGIAQGLLLARA